MFFGDQHKTITSCYEMLSRKVCEKYQLTQMEYDILIFLHNNPRHNTAAEIVKIRKSTKSHVSSSLKNLESRGLVKRVQSTDNKKHIEIVSPPANTPLLHPSFSYKWPLPQYNIPLTYALTALNNCLR